VAAALERCRPAPAARLGSRKEGHRDCFLTKLRDRVLGAMEHRNAVANRPAFAAGHRRRQQLLTGRSDRPARAAPPTSRAAMHRPGPPGVVETSRALHLDEDRIGVWCDEGGPADLFRGHCRGRRDIRPRQREQRGGEVFTGIEGAPLSEPFVVLDRGAPYCRHRPCTHHNDVIVPGRLNDSWMSGTLLESNVYRTGCSPAHRVPVAHTIGAEPPSV